MVTAMLYARSNRLHKNESVILGGSPLDKVKKKQYLFWIILICSIILLLFLNYSCFYHNRAFTVESRSLMEVNTPLKSSVTDEAANPSDPPADDAPVQKPVDPETLKLVIDDLLKMRKPPGFDQQFKRKNKNAEK